MSNRQAPSDRIERSDSLAASDLPVDSALPAWITPELIEDTIRVWQPYYATALTPQDAITIVRDLGRLLDVLCRNETSKSQRKHADGANG